MSLVSTPESVWSGIKVDLRANRESPSHVRLPSKGVRTHFIAKCVILKR